MKKQGKSKRGGARPNAGRRPNADYKVREIFKQAFDAAMGYEDWVKLIKRAKKTDKFLMYLIDQRIGRATQTLALDPDSDPLTKVIIQVNDTRNGNKDGSNERLHADSGGVEDIQDNS